jgi:glycine/D-amino acid oxidase-like deaminating enzyme
MEQFDVIVIGAGPAGSALAGRCADGGLHVALVERQLIGSECSYWASVPSKTLIRPGDIIAAARQVRGASEAVTGHVDVQAALAHIRPATGTTRVWPLLRTASSSPACIYVTFPVGSLPFRRLYPLVLSVHPWCRVRNSSDCHRDSGGVPRSRQSE